MVSIPFDGTEMALPAPAAVRRAFRRAEMALGLHVMTCRQAAQATIGSPSAGGLIHVNAGRPCCSRCSGGTLAVAERDLPALDPRAQSEAFLVFFGMAR